jgi:hypothetical protein
MFKTKNDEYFVLSFKDEFNVIQYIKSCTYKNQKKVASNPLKYKKYIYLTKNLNYAKIWKKRNGAFRMAKNMFAPTLGINMNSMFIENITKQRIRKQKILELGLLD